MSRIGWHGVGMNGPVPITWSDIRDWTAFAGIDVPPWEAEAYMAASRAFCSQYATSKNNPAVLLPWHFELVGDELERALAWEKRKLG